jgi:hypothetical protein
LQQRSTRENGLPPHVYAEFAKRKKKKEKGKKKKEEEEEEEEEER